MKSLCYLVLKRVAGRDGRTAERTDRIAIDITRYSYASSRA